MEYCKNIMLKDGGLCCLRNGTEKDGKAVLENFLRTHEETDYLLTYPEETSFTEEQESGFLKVRQENPKELLLLAEIDGKIAGTAGVEALGSACKLCHRAELGISVEKEYWGRGIGRALLEACIESARTAGYRQLELSVVSENERAVALYKQAGFSEYGRNPRGFRSRISGYQELVLMRLEL